LRSIANGRWRLSERGAASGRQLLEKGTRFYLGDRIDQLVKNPNGVATSAGLLCSALKELIDLDQRPGTEAGAVERGRDRGFSTKAAVWRTSASSRLSEN
jgi:hypothetical protein